MMPFAAVPESDIGTSRRFVAPPEFGRYRGHSGQSKATSISIYEYAPWRRLFRGLGGLAEQAPDGGFGKR